MTKEEIEILRESTLEKYKPPSVVVGVCEEPTSKEIKEAERWYNEIIYIIVMAAMKLINSKKK